MKVFLKCLVSILVVYSLLTVWAVWHEHNFEKNARNISDEDAEKLLNPRDKQHRF